MIFVTILAIGHSPGWEREEETFVQNVQKTVEELASLRGNTSREPNDIAERVLPAPGRAFPARGEALPPRL